MNLIPRSTPVQEGINPEYIINFLNECEKSNIEIHSFLLARHNKIVFEAHNAPYDGDNPYIVHSFTKILTNTAVDLTYTDGLLKLDDPIHMYFPELDGTEIDNEYYRACTIRDLITMRSGQKRSSWND